MKTTELFKVTVKARVRARDLVVDGEHDAWHKFKLLVMLNRVIYDIEPVSKRRGK